MLSSQELVNLLTQMDPLIQGFTQGAAEIFDSTYIVDVLCNYFFSFTYTFVVLLTCWFITDKIVEPRLLKSMPVHISDGR